MSLPIRQAVILAAGLGSRLRATDTLPKPLTPVCGVPLLKRTVLTLGRGGIREAVVVVGFARKLVESVLVADEDIAALGIALRFIENPDYTLGNGVSVLAAEGQIADGFVLSMADHVYDQALVELACRSDLTEADLYLCVDRRVSEIYDIDDATKVRTHGDLIVDIGKHLAVYDCIDCGVFAVTPALLDVLREARAQRGDCSLSDGVRALAAIRRARVVDIGTAFWQDVDTLEALARAESILASGSD